MRFAAIAIVTAGAAVLASAQPARAQFGGGMGGYSSYGNMNAYGANLRGPSGFPSQPALTPWLNMVRGGNPAANYFLGVLPEFDRRYFQAAVNATLPVLESSALAAQQAVDLARFRRCGRRDTWPRFRPTAVSTACPARRGRIIRLTRTRPAPCRATRGSGVRGP